MLSLRFNPLPHAEGDENPSFSIHLRKCFNPLPHAEGDTDALTQPPPLNVFQSTPSRRGRHCSFIHFRLFIICFNPLPHAEGDIEELLVPNIISVSIHSLTQRETNFLHALDAFIAFQSTPSRRGRLQCYIIPVSARRFQSTPSRRGRRLILYCVRNPEGFNPLPHAEGDRR